MKDNCIFSEKEMHDSYLVKVFSQNLLERHKKGAKRHSGLVGSYSSHPICSPRQGRPTGRVSTVFFLSKCKHDHSSPCLHPHQRTHTSDLYGNHFIYVWVTWGETQKLCVKGIQLKFVKLQLPCAITIHSSLLIKARISN